MNPKWLHLAGELLDNAAGRYSNDGCNDWGWPEDWSEEERREFAIAVAEDNLGKPLSGFTEEEVEDYVHYRSESAWGPANWSVMRFLAGRLVGVE